MKHREKKSTALGIILLTVFALWTLLIQTIDVQPIGPNGTDVGFASMNHFFHKWIGIHMALYVITDWLGLVPFFVCTIFGGMGLVQLIQRKKLQRVDRDLLVLGVHYALTMLAYFAFEMFPVNYRPILIAGALETSYPSSTTLLVLCVMPTLALQSQRRCPNALFRKCIPVLSAVFCIFMVMMRMLSGVHWLTDIIGAILLSAALFHLYYTAVQPIPTQT